MEKSLAQIWHDSFANWPTRFRRKGVIVTSTNEPIGFVDFVMTEDVVVLERATPDSAGSRRVTLPFSLIAALKYTEPLKTEQFLAAGFSKGNVETKPAPRAAVRKAAVPSPAPQAAPAPVPPTPPTQALPTPVNSPAANPPVAPAGT